jgi:hypothetical protein
MQIDAAFMQFQKDLRSVSYQMAVVPEIITARPMALHSGVGCRSFLGGNGHVRVYLPEATWKITDVETRRT